MSRPTLLFYIYIYKTIFNRAFSLVKGQKPWIKKRKKRKERTQEMLCERQSRFKSQSIRSVIIFKCRTVFHDHCETIISIKRDSDIRCQEVERIQRMFNRLEPKGSKFVTIFSSIQI